ncbi:predicted protein [Sparassis crispa]|uniref:Fungal-type protein kinase domain-containing protein n=1 Tax=Sparassis crispa TaxID=139825 RepID=A0A401GQV7_9APHY|nr:predicted protein [Sparassis crispa]GBE84617.1 predicted protein [Sparassis crispa]
MVATPLAKKDLKYNVWQQEDFDHYDIRRRYRQYADSAQGFILGPMPVEEFLEFLPETDMSNMPRPVNAFNKVPAEAGTEQQIYNPLIAAINGIRTRSRKSQRRCPGFTFKGMATSGAELGDIGSMNAHVCCYSQDLNDSHFTSAGPLGCADLYIDVQRHPGLDPFTDPGPEDDRSEHAFFQIPGDHRAHKEAEEAFGRNVACATEACSRQHRTFYFSISLAGSRARFLRWDRCGVIASESFDVRAQPEHLCEFLWRYAHASNSQRGYDVSVELATTGEEELFRDSIKRHVKFQLDPNDEELVAAMDEHYQPGAVVAINVVDEGSPDCVAHRLLVSRPVVSPVSWTGKGTRGFWAVTADSPKGEVVFLKDTWRHNIEDMKEGNILADLHSTGVPNIPRLVHHGDVWDQLPVSSGRDDGESALTYKRDETTVLQYTQTDLFRHAVWVCTGGENHKLPPPLVHYRLVLGTAGYPLQRIRGTKELLHAAYDAYEAMVAAFHAEPGKRRLHRDISVGNIILSKDPDSGENIRRGYLIDWESSCLVTEGEACDHSRTGTIQFMSIRLLRSGESISHSFQDDMESMLWVVLYSNLLWLGHNLSPNTVVTYLFELFDDTWINQEGILKGGDGKLSNQYSQNFTGKVHFSNPAFREWLDAVIKFNSSHVFPHLQDVESAMVWKNPEMFGKFWKDFLSTHELSNDDRFSRKLYPRGTTWRRSPSSTLSSTSSNAETAHPTPVALPSRKRKVADDAVALDSERTTNSRVPAVSRGHYTGPITRSMTKRRQVEGQGVVVGGSDLPPRWSLRHLRPRPAKVDNARLAQQGRKVRRSKK